MSTAPVEFVPQEIEDMAPAAAIESILMQSVRLRASDLFFIAQEGHFLVSVRRLGTIERLLTVSQPKGRQLVSAIKAQAGMDLAETMRPQDARWIFRSDDFQLDLRINEIPTLYGNDLTLRLLERESQLVELENLGFVADQLGKVKNMLSSPSGLILVTGPTGVGKTTSMYAFVHQLNDGKRKINTIEDPIEYAVRGICQSQVAPKIDLDFAELLRSVMRQSPDVIMIGEIRDQETAVTAVRAANSGHLVLATLHAPVAVLAVQSMILFGSQPVMLANSLLGVVAQRLLRTLNPATRIQYDVGGAHKPFEEVEDLLRAGEGESIYGPDEQDSDSQNGYLARTGLFEVLTITDQVRESIAQQGSRQELHRAAIESGMLDFRRVALLKVAKGVTSIEEMTRVLPAELLALDS